MNKLIRIELTPDALRVLLTVLRRSDPLGVYVAALVADIEKQAATQPKEQDAP